MLCYLGGQFLISFWNSIEDYKTIKNIEKRKEKALMIYSN